MANCKRRLRALRLRSKEDRWTHRPSLFRLSPPLLRRQSCRWPCPWDWPRPWDWTPLPRFHLRFRQKLAQGYPFLSFINPLGLIRVEPCGLIFFFIYIIFEHKTLHKRNQTLCHLDYQLVLVFFNIFNFVLGISIAIAISWFFVFCFLQYRMQLNKFLDSPVGKSFTVSIVLIPSPSFPFAFYGWISNKEWSGK